MKEFVFEFWGARHDPKWDAYFLLGRLRRGTVSIGDKIIVSTAERQEVGTVDHFWDNLYGNEWLGWFSSLSTDTIADPFCIKLSGLSSMPLCPSTAYGKLS